MQGKQGDNIVPGQDYFKPKDTLKIRREVFVGKHHSFRRSGGAGGIKERGDVAGIIFNRYFFRLYNIYFLKGIKKRAFKRKYIFNRGSSGS